MAQPFGVGDVVGGRYRITGHVVTSADQDIIFQAIDQVLDRPVSVLLASRANAKQVATSAKELATGERSSDVQVLDLGLTEDRTYLISSIVDPNELLDLVVPDSAPYVEPYFTDSLGSELFGQSRQMQPQTYDDDAEYYARLQADLAGASEPGRRIPGLPRRRPAFLDKVTVQHADPEQASTPSAEGRTPTGRESGESESEGDTGGPIPRTQASEQGSRIVSLETDLEEVHVDPAADLPGEVLQASYAWVPKTHGPSPDAKRGAPSETSSAQQGSPSEGPFYESAPSAAISTVPVGSSSAVYPPVEVDAMVADGEEVIDDPPEEPDPSFDPSPDSPEVADSFDSDAAAATQVAAEETSRATFGADQEAASFTGLISAVPTRTPASFPAAEREAGDSLPQNSADQGRAGARWWVSALVLAILVLTAAVILFTVLGGD